MSIRDFIFSTGTAGSRATDAGVTVLRVGAGLLLAFVHGINKVPPSEGFIGRVGGMGFPAPELFAWLAAAAEFGGGLLVAVGLLTRPAALLWFVHFLIVVFLAHAGDSIADRELPMLFAISALAVLLIGPGRYSLDATIAGRAPADRP
jgi:putative oxidoreductase